MNPSSRKCLRPARRSRTRCSWRILSHPHHHPFQESARMSPHQGCRLLLAVPLIRPHSIFVYRLAVYLRLCRVLQRCSLARFGSEWGWKEERWRGRQTLLLSSGSVLAIVYPRGRFQVLLLRNTCSSSSTVNEIRNEIFFFFWGWFCLAADSFHTRATGYFFAVEHGPALPVRWV